MAINLNRLRKADECKGFIRKVISPQQLVELAKNKVCPHYLVMNPSTKEEHYYFIPSELEEWLVQNHIKLIDGSFFPEIKFLEFTPIKPINEIPLEISAIKDLFEIPFEAINTPPGIYFLCLNNMIQYIGQAINIGNRVIHHFKEDKIPFNSIYWIQCPLNRLDALEAALIRKLKPAYNKLVPLRSDKLDELLLTGITKK
jgi:hypothetical protein